MTEMTPEQKQAAADRMAHARAQRGQNKTPGAPEGLAMTDDAMADRAEAQREAVEVQMRAEEQRHAATVAAQPVPTDDRPSNNTRVANTLAGQAELRIRAARQRADAGLGASLEMVTVRITKQGDGKVSMGKHFGGIGEAYYEWKEEVTLPETVAKALEDRGLAEIL